MHGILFHHPDLFAPPTTMFSPLSSSCCSDCNQQSEYLLHLVFPSLSPCQDSYLPLDLELEGFIVKYKPHSPSLTREISVNRQHIGTLPSTADSTSIDTFSSNGSTCTANKTPRAPMGTPAAGACRPSQLESRSDTLVFLKGKKSSTGSEETSGDLVVRLDDNLVAL